MNSHSLSLKPVFRYLRLEELIFLIFFTVIVYLSFLEGKFLIFLYKDRLVYSFAILIIFIACFRINMFLWKSNAIIWSDLFREIISCGTILRDFFSLLMCWSMYSTMSGILSQLEIKDPWLIAADRWLFGIDPSVWIEKFAHPSLTLFLTVIYVAFFLYMPVLFIFLYRMPNRRGLREFLLSLVIACFWGYLGYTLVPAIGPQFTLRTSYKTDLWDNTTGKIAQEALSFWDVNRIPKDCFPSMHVCLSVLSLLFAWRFVRFLFWIFLPCVIALIISTIYLRYHYVVDVFAGLAIAFICYWLTPTILTFWNNLLEQTDADL